MDDVFPWEQEHVQQGELPVHVSEDIRHDLVRESGDADVDARAGHGLAVWCVNGALLWVIEIGGTGGDVA
jgi:hypothetical protein